MIIYSYIHPHPSPHIEKSLSRTFVIIPSLCTHTVYSKCVCLQWCSVECTLQAFKLLSALSRVLTFLPKGRFFCYFYFSVHVLEIHVTITFYSTLSQIDTGTLKGYWSLFSPPSAGFDSQTHMDWIVTGLTSAALYWITVAGVTVVMTNTKCLVSVAHCWLFFWQRTLSDTQANHQPMILSYHIK